MIEYLKRLNRYRNRKLKEIKNALKKFRLNRKKKVKSIFNADVYNSILIVMCDLGIGDVIITSFLIYELREKNYKVSVVVDERIKFLFENFIEVDNLFIFNKRSIKKFIKSVKKIKIDLAIDLYDEGENSLRRVEIISSFNPLHTLGFNQSQFLQYDTSIKYTEYDAHITTRSCIILNLLNITYNNVQYHLNLYEQDVHTAKIFLNSICSSTNEFIIIFCPFSSSKEKSFSKKQIEGILTFLSEQKNCTTIIVGEQKDISNINELPNIFINRNPSFSFTSALISLSDLVLTVDTSIVHVASAYNIRMIAIYNNRYNSKFNLNKVWSPIGSNYSQIFTNENRRTILGDPVYNLDINLIIKKLKKTIEHYRNRLN